MNLSNPCLELIWSEEHKEIRLKTEGKDIAVKLMPCFPWQHPDSHLSIRDKEDNEIGFIESLYELSEASLITVQRALSETLFCFEVEDILKIEDEYELRLWSVRTSQGKRSFQTKLTDWPRALSNGGYMIKDVHGDIFLIRDPKVLSQSGKKQFTAFVD